MNRLCGIAVFFLAVICGGAQGVAQVDQTSTRAAPAWATRTLRAGMIGTDTSHVPAFAEIFQIAPGVENQPRCGIQRRQPGYPGECQSC